MTATTGGSAPRPPIAALAAEDIDLDEHLRLRLQIENFFFEEADLLDEHQFDKWLELLTDDVRYWMPVRRNVPSEEMETENTAETHDMSWFDEGRSTLIMRVQQIKTGVHWADEPFSRTSHLITNVRLLDVRPSEVRTRCGFIVYRNRMTDEESVLVGKRLDTLRRVDGKFKIARREILLDQNVLLAKNLTTFF